MCVIIVQPPTAYLTKADAEAAWKMNPDGGGFAFIDQETNKVDTWKTMNFNSFWSSFERARSQNRQSPFIIHMRIATHGSVCIDNVHPFWVDEHTVMAHNGIIRGVPETLEDDDRSDTRLFIDLVLPDLGEAWLDNKIVVDMVEEWIGWSKLAFLTVNPALKQNYYILGEKSGHWENRMWYSNLYHWGFAKKTNVVTTGNWKGGVDLVNAQLARYSGTSYKTEQDYEDEHWSWENDRVIARAADKDFSDFGRLTLDIEDDFGNDQILSVMEVREANGYSWPMSLSKFSGSIVCLGCRQVVDEPDGDCECYSWACMNCVRFLNDCECNPEEVLIRPDSMLDEETLNYLISTTP